MLSGYQNPFMVICLSLVVFFTYYMNTNQVDHNTRSIMNLSLWLWSWLDEAKKFLSIEAEIMLWL